MSKKATEIAILPIPASVDLASGDSGKIWTDTLTTITSQAGAIAAYWGRQIEHPDVVQLVVEWESLEAHKDFISKPSYKPFLDNVGSVLTSPPLLYHTYFPESSPFSEVAAAPVLECLSLYFDPAYSTSEYDSNFENFKKEGEKTAAEAKGITGGWGEEEHDKEEVEGGKAKLFAAFIGWPSVEAHLEYRKSEHFPGVVKHLRDGPKAVGVYHVAFQKFEK
ncbi:hypothetical protein BDV96DRAFT_537006 [Lophiotrema nucula]|uniref:ABM domain-containing protein n=1 Tax=Lophiotrema nucula TaxID=690887 RepID=A0A6A5ZUR9_9PLEO|nr:hypothetical protein BDV96DRAFT_537006 [Lophiotrema nucula]